MNVEWSDILHVEKLILRFVTEEN